MLIGVRVGVGGDSVGEFLADCQALEGAGAHLLLLADGDLDPVLLTAAMAVVTHRSQLLAPAASESQLATLAALARGRLAETLDEGWVEIEFPASRDVWAELRRRHEEAGARGLILPNDPRLMDLLRNPDVEEDRSDLQLAQG